MMQWQSGSSYVNVCILPEIGREVLKSQEAKWRLEMSASPNDLSPATSGSIRVYGSQLGGVEDRQ